MSQHYATLHQSTVHQLYKFIEEKITAGYEISTVASVGQLYYADGVAVSDWLVMWKKANVEYEFPAMQDSGVNPYG